MNTISKYIITAFIILLLISSLTCIKTPYKTIEDVLPAHQWRKTLEAVYNENNEFEKYTFNFETAEDCEKNSYYTFGNKYNDLYGDYVIHYLCNNTLWISYRWRILNDTLLFIPYDFDSLHTKFSRFIDYYDERSFVLRHDTLIKGSNKKIKETYSAFK